MNLITLSTRYATATVSPYGAQVMSFALNGLPDVLWTTSDEFLEAAVAKGKALRGGIPLCWPWFLAHPTAEGAPSHGVGRLRTWRVVEHVETDEESRVVLTCELDGTEGAWPYQTEGRVTVTLTEMLEVALETTNRSGEAFTMTEALHTYIRVGEVEEIAIEGVSGLNRKHVSSGTELSPIYGPRAISGEVEELVFPVSELAVTDPVLRRKVVVTNHGSDEFVIWNPGPEKAAGLDMPEGSCKQMVCLEAANIDAKVTLGPGESHTLTTRLRVSVKE